MSAETTFEELLMMIAQKHHIRGMGTHKQATAQNQWLYREITDSACAASVEAQCERLREDFATQIEHFRGRELFDGISDLPDSLNRVTDLGDTFGLQSIELARAQAHRRATQGVPEVGITGRANRMDERFHTVSTRACACA